MSQQSLNRRIWTGRASRLNVAPGQLEQAIDQLKWQPADVGVSEETTGAAVLRQFVLKHNLHVTHYARCDKFLPLWLYGLRSDFSKGVAQAYFVEAGSEAMLIAWDYFPKNGALRPLPSSPPTRSRSRQLSPEIASRAPAAAASTGAAGFRPA